MEYENILPYIQVALYARVSLDETDPTKKRYQNPDNQLQPLQDWAKAMNYSVKPEHIYIDRMTGKNPNRKEFRRMMADASMHRFRGILVWKIDRFSREGVLATLSYIQQLKDRGCFLKSLTEGWLDTSNNGITELVLSVMAWAAAEERRKISERTAAGIARLKKSGKWKGGRPRKKGTPV